MVVVVVGAEECIYECRRGAGNALCMAKRKTMRDNEMAI